MHEWYIREDEIGANYAVFYASITIFFVIAGPLAYFRLFTTEQSLGVFGDGLMQTIPYMFGALFWVIYWGASLVCGLTAITREFAEQYVARVMKEGAGAYIRASMPSCPGPDTDATPSRFPIGVGNVGKTSSRGALARICVPYAAGIPGMANEHVFEV